MTIALIITGAISLIAGIAFGAYRKSASKPKEKPDKYPDDYKKLKDWADLLEKYNTLNYLSPDVKILDDYIDAIMEKYRDKPSPTQH